MHTYWIMVANAAMAAVYASNNILNSSGDWQLIATLQHPQTKKKRHELVTDRHGYHKIIGTTQGVYAEPSDPKEVERERFAQQLTKLLEHGHSTKQFQEFILIAPAHFHGLLAKHFSPPLQKCLKHSIHKDYTSKKVDEIKHLVTA